MLVFALRQFYALFPKFFSFISLTYFIPEYAFFLFFHGALKNFSNAFYSSRILEKSLK